ncbi:hypothetical protein KR222_003066, partial [Zaprionus bogoriensis]
MTPIEQQRVKILTLKALEVLHIDNMGRVRNLLKQTNLNTISLVTLFLLVTVISAGFSILCRRKEGVTFQVNAVPLQHEIVKNETPMVHSVRKPL